MSEAMKVHLSPAFFTEREKTLVERGELSASAFAFDSGVAGLRLKNAVGELVLLPYQGQQIWSAHFAGRELTMKSMFTQPNPTRSYLDTYGGFLLHCGATAMGVPTGTDSHPLHGELPNAPYQRAYLLAGEDRKGAYLALGGEYTHTVAFSHHYAARPLVKLYAGSALFEVSLVVANLKRTPMELMYLAHINYRPVDHARLVYSAPCTPEHARVRKSIPSHVKPLPGYKELLEEFGRHPEKHNLVDPALLFDPEVVFALDYLADADGWAHTLQVHPDGGADYVRHRPAQLDRAVRWISRTPDQDAMGLVLPGTAEPEGYSVEKAKGNLKVIAPQGEWRCDMELGVLSAAEAAKVEAKVERVLG